MADKTTIEQRIKNLTEIYEGIRDERRTYANTATRIGNAFLALLSYLSDAPYLRKDIDDTMSGLLTLLKGCIIGENGCIKMNPDGSITCGSIRVDGSAIFNELVFNHQNVLEGDTYFTDRAIIESVEHTDLNQYTLTFRKEYDDETVTFHANDILLARVNNLDKGRTYRSSWMRVESVDTNSNIAVVTLYDNKDVPGGVNSAPAAASRVIRYGNAVDESRQSCWFVSSNDGRWLFLQGVSKPNLEDNDKASNYAGFVGLPPDIAAIRPLIDKGIISKSQPYCYFRGMIAQDFIKIDYNGNPQYIARDKGQWSASERYIKGYDEVARGFYTDRVWHGGCYWQCAVDECTGSEPRYGNTDWVCLIGGENMDVDIQSSAGDFFRAGSVWETDLTATVWNAELQIKDELLAKMQVNWQRISEDLDGDKAWNAKHPTSMGNLQIHISSKVDISSEWGAGSKVGFKCTVIFPDGTPYDGNYTVTL